MLRYRIYCIELVFGQCLYRKLNTDKIGLKRKLMRLHKIEHLALLPLHQDAAWI